MIGLFGGSFLPCRLLQEYGHAPVPIGLLGSTFMCCADVTSIHGLIMGVHVAGSYVQSHSSMLTQPNLATWVGCTGVVEC